ncbi:MAG TPA: PEP/pyruvate-binding domain-containing protein [Pyrinomonadaceae bacterium]|jgi:hypothetical protein
MGWAAEVSAQRAARRTDGLPAAKAVGREAETSGEPRWLPAIVSHQQFDRIARTYNRALLTSPPHVLFVIDQQDKDKIYYVNMNFYELHEVFINSMHLSLERGRVFWEHNHLRPNRRFLLGRILYLPIIKRYAFEFWEGEALSAAQLALTARVINRSFFTRVAYKPTSTFQEHLSAEIRGLARVLPTDLKTKFDYQPFNTARGVGRVRILDRLDENTNVSPDEILVLGESPISLSPVAGIVVTKPSTPLSHVNILARSWEVPNAYINNGAAHFKRYEGQWVSFETKYDSFELKGADAAQIRARQQQLALRRKRMTPRADLSVKRLASLGEQRAESVTAYGAKSANLGELVQFCPPGFTVPEGFTIPFFYYDQFVRENRLEEPIRQMLADERFARDVAYRRARLAELRAAFARGLVNAGLQRELLQRVQAGFAGKGLFVRSSSNTEDLPNFSGAGLYLTVPNVRTGPALVEAVKNVWGSLWNFEAYEARAHAGVDHGRAMMAVLLQEGVNADSAGVMITLDPFNPERRGLVYINAKSGLGIKVVEGKRVAEQLIYNTRTGAVQVLTRSAEDSLLKFDERGGVREVPIFGRRAVLTDDVVRRLAAAAAAVKRVFGGREQDIEWVMMGGRLYIVQARPYSVSHGGL